jgi:hypothetical protein
MSYRYKTYSNIDAYGDTENVIHFKFGDMRKSYNFTEEFRAKYPNFCKEYSRYFSGENSLFSDPLSIVNYIEAFKLPLKLYSNMVDEEFADIEAAKEWICNEWGGRNRDKLYHFKDSKYVGLD